MSKKKANGEHSIYYVKDKKLYRGQITVGYNENGKLKRKSVYGKTKKEVIEKLAQIEYGIKTGTFVDKSTITIYMLGKQMLDDELNLNYIKEATYHRHIETLKRLQPIYNTTLQTASEMQIKDFLLKEQNYSQSTINKEYQLLKKIFEEAIKRNIISKSPMQYIKKPNSKKAKEKVRALTVDEQKKLLEVLTTEDVYYSQQMLLSMLTGMRMGEINALDIKDINFNFNTITISKTISRGSKGEAILNNSAKTQAGMRTIPMSEDVKAILLDSTQEVSEGLIFTHNDKMVTTSQVNSQYKRILAKYEIIDNSVSGKVDLHSLRHTYASRCIEAGMQPKVLQLLLGHTDITITMNTYCDAFDSFRNDNINLANKYLQDMGLSISPKEEQKAVKKA